MGLGRFQRPTTKALHALRNIVASQKSVCDKFGVDFFPPKDCEKIGIAIETIGKMPINGMRINPENGTCGWYIFHNRRIPKTYFTPICPSEPRVKLN